MYRRRALMYVQQVEDQKAIEDFTQALRRQKSDPCLHAKRAPSHLRLREHSAAISDLKQVLAVEPGRVSASEALARLYVTGPAEVRDPRKALPLAQKAAQSATDRAAALNTLGNVYYRLGEFARAVEILLRAGGIRSGCATAEDLYFLAMSCYRGGERDKARECYDRALQWGNDHPQLSPPVAEQLTQFRAEAAAVLAKVSP